MDKQVKIEFNFPDQQFESREDFIEEMTNSLTAKEKDGPALFAYKKHWLQDFYVRYKDGDIGSYHPLGKDIEEQINSTVEEVIGDCADLLPFGDSTLYIFVLPWFPGEDEEMFEGTMGQAPWQNTIKLYVDTNDFSFESLRETIAHEYNHAIFFQNIPSAQKTILDSVIMEGLAENFREVAVGGEPAEWSTALKNNEIVEALGKLKGSFDAYDYNIYNDLFYGGDRFQRWTGYSIGYQVVKSYLKQKDNIAWEKVMNTDPQKILEGSEFAD